MFIIHAAVMYSNGETFTGRDYQHILQTAQKLGYTGEHINGFTNSSGEFLLPHEAAVIAARSGQVNQKVKQLAPDDLWPVFANEL